MRDAKDIRSITILYNQKFPDHFKLVLLSSGSSQRLYMLCKWPQGNLNPGPLGQRGLLVVNRIPWLDYIDRY